jgi:hypothetical protein
MNEDEIVLDENSNTSEEVELEPTETEEVDWKALALKEKQRADNLKIRAEKAEKQGKVEPEGRISQDLIALTNAKVHEDDVPEVEDYAKYKKISVADALKSNVIKTLLAEKRELRDSANVANTGPSRRSNAKPSADAMLKNAREGKEVDDAEALASARFMEKHGK